MFSHFRTLVVLFAGLSLLSGCGDTTARDAWKSTKVFYGEYINPQASINYDDKGEMDAASRSFASNMQIVDRELIRLERFLRNQDKTPTGEGVEQLLRSFPWLSGVAAIDPDGKVLVQEPPVAIKPIDFTAVLEPSPLGERRLRKAVVDTPLGPEVLIAVPIFASADLKGLYVPHFEMQSLMRITAKPEEVMVFTPSTVLWPGRFAGNVPVNSKDWVEITKSEVAGKVTGAGEDFLWVCRFVGGSPVIFAAPAKVAEPVTVEEAAQPEGSEFSGEQPEQADQETKASGSDTVAAAS